MYLNAFLVEDLAQALDDLLRDKKLVYVFSTGKFEIYLLFSDAITLKIQFFKGEAFFQEVPPEHIQKGNRLPLFKEIHDQVIKKVYAYPLDRIIRFDMNNKHSLVFYLFGKFSQIALYSDKVLLSQFPVKAKKLELLPEPVSFSMQDLEGWSMQDLVKRIPFLSDSDLDKLRNLGFGSGINTEAFYKFKRLYHTYYSPEIRNGKLIPGPFSPGDPNFLLKVLSRFTQQFIAEESLKDRKKDLILETEKKIRILKDRKRKLNENLRFLEEATGYREQADLIMANLHRISSGTEEIILEDFTSGAPVKIRLKKELSPQANAERLYRKAKNESKQLKYLQSSLLELGKELEKEQDRLEKIALVDNYKDLKAVEKGKAPMAELSRLPYKSLMVDGFEIRIGKSSKDNDELLSKHCNRSDIWLHAHGVSGSHVIIRIGKGQAVPDRVLQAAASLAALNSKAKHEGLAPVVYTERKYVRKPRKAAPGAVLIEREKLIMAEPRMIIE